MPESPAASARAIFLSYASQDTKAAERICTALRAGGIEVWFDQSELRGGDAWDAKIKQQIQTCYLFMPVISQQTQQREEGYFRREWNLAVNRTLDMAHDKAFLLPVVIDPIPDGAARVPEKFREVQWTRLPGGEVPAEFVQRVQALVAGTVPPFSMRAAESGARYREEPARRPGWAMAAVVAALLAVVAYLALRPTAPEKTVAETKPAAAAAARVISDKSIAVLPFDNRSPDEANKFFADGVHDDIQTTLCNIRALRVVSRTSVEQYRGTKKSVKQIAEELGVAYVLGGSVQRAGNTVRVSGQLIDARSDTEVWAHSYDRDLTDVFTIQTALATEIAGALQAVLSPQEQKLIANAPTKNLAANELYHKAMDLVDRLAANDVDAFSRAEPLLQSAVEIDPNFAPAWGQLAVILLRHEAKRRDPTGARLPAAQRAIDTMERVAPDSIETRLLLATYYTRRLDFARAEAYLQRAAEVAPNNAEVVMLLGDAAKRHDRFAEALAQYRRAYTFDRQSFVIRKTLRDWLLRLRHYDEAGEVERDDPHAEGYLPGRLPFLKEGATEKMKALIAARPEIMSEDTMNWWWATDAAEYVRRCTEARRTGGVGALSSSDETRMAFALMALGDTARAHGEATNQVAIARATGGFDSRLLAVNLALLGDKPAALATLDAYLKTGREKQNNYDLTTQPTCKAVVLTWVGEKEQALAELARLLSVPSGLNVHEMRHEPYWQPLHGDPRFEALLNDPKNNAPLF